jgi:chromosome segregation ATPase
MEKDYLDWAYRTTEAVVRTNEILKVYAGPDISHSEFRRLCDEAARQGRDAEIKKTEDSFNKKIDTIQGRLTREERELANDRARHSHRKMEEMGSHAETLFSLIGGRKKSLSSSLTKRRMTEQAKAAVKESEESIADYKRQIEALEKEKAEAIRQVNDRWGGLASESQEIKVTPFKKGCAG